MTKTRNRVNRWAIAATPLYQKKTSNRSVLTANTPESLASFVESTVAFTLHDWQRYCLCPILERLRTEKGLRILLHAPPQFGKSVLVSQRLPAYLIGHEPTHRVALACYNETHSSNFGAVVRDLMASEEYAEMFPQSVVSKDAAAGEFWTGPRKALRDAQPSFKAMGLLSGFTGKSADTLIIDDPYKSAADAESAAVNGSVWRWWTATARPRMKASSNVVVMFHRYHDDDLAAKLIKEGNWEYYRFPAIADGLDEGIDPTGRCPGEVLSPMRSLEELEAEKASDPTTFAGQFQGVPSGDVGNFFKGELKAVPLPENITRAVRAWDIAATEGAGDYTAGVAMTKTPDGKFVILPEVVLIQSGPDEVDAAILAAAANDGKKTDVRLAQDPGSAGKRDALALSRKLAGYSVGVERVSGSKESRARPFAAQVNLGNVGIVESDTLVTSGPYRGMTVTNALRRMIKGFPHSSAKKDGVDAASDAFARLTSSGQWGFR